MLIICCMTGPTLHLQTIASGEELTVIMSPSMWLHCEFLNILSLFFKFKFHCLAICCCIVLLVFGDFNFNIVEISCNDLLLLLQ